MFFNIPSYHAFGILSWSWIVGRVGSGFKVYSGC
jgi:hypothetical protein